MTHPFRSLVAALAILAVCLTAGAVGAARGQAAAAGEMVICSGGAAVTVAVDADGNPTGPPHWCPDCVMSLFAAAVVTEAAAIPPAGVSPVGNLPVRAHPVAPSVLAPSARGPPSLA